MKKTLILFVLGAVFITGCSKDSTRATNKRSFIRFKNKRGY